ncbi:MAG: alpha/beta fold hydrolase [Acidobacteriota bacterium]
MRMPTCVLVVGLGCAAAALAAAPETGKAVVESGFVHSGNGELFCESAGTGDTIVLIHDGLLHRETWDDQFTELSKDHHVIRYDRRGYGRSPKPTEPYSNLEDLESLFQQLKVDKADLIGCSAGGRLAIDFTLAHPDKVRSLVLVGAVVSGMGYSDHFFSRGGRLTEEIKASPELLREYFIERDPYAIYPENRVARDKARRLLDQNPQNFPPENDSFQKRDPTQAVKILGQVSAPALILIGEYDIPDVFVHAGAIEAGLPDVQREVVSKAGHLVHMEQPQEFNRLVRDFLNENVILNAVLSDDTGAAAPLVEKLRAASPNQAPSAEGRFIAVARLWMGEAKVKEAIDLLKLTVDISPKSALAHVALAEAYKLKGDRDAALASVKKTMELYPQCRRCPGLLAEIEGLPVDGMASEKRLGKMVLVPGGTFVMGRPAGSMKDAVSAPVDNPPHEVTLDSFHIDKTEVTNAEYFQFCAATDRKLPVFWGMAGFHCGPDFPNHPIVGVSYDDAKSFAEWQGLRLPTEAEWEYAARGGLVEKPFPNGDELTAADANFARQTIGTLPVGSFKPNGYGLCDMAGNVVEYVADAYDAAYYEKSPGTNPCNPDGKFFVIRGGGWHSGKMCNRVYYRNALKTGWLDFAVGFRCARDAKESPKAEKPAGK